jgi:imidazolonepropionase-like amidohydrolase
MGWSDRVGSVEPGKFAELTAVPGDPLRWNVSQPASDASFLW